MPTNYFTLHALVAEWAPAVVECEVRNVFSQSRSELTLALANSEKEWMLRFSCRSPHRFAFRSEGYSRARRNVATLFSPSIGKHVTGLRIADRDRMLYFDLEGGHAIQVMLFGPRANVFLVDAGERVVEAFLSNTENAGCLAPAPKPAPLVDTLAAFEARWRTDRKTTERAVAAAVPLFNRTLADAVVHRAGVKASTPSACTSADRQTLFEAAIALRDELETPTPRIYWRGRFPEAFALTCLPTVKACEDLTEELFETVDAAVRVFVRRRLAEARFRAVYSPLEKALTATHDHYRASAERMLEALSRESRADDYERRGHLLMTNPAAIPMGAETTVVPDHFDGGIPTTIPLDPALSAVENAQHYYDRARRTRQARTHAETRLESVESRAVEAGELLSKLRHIDTYKEIERFKKDEAGRLAPFLSQETRPASQVPFRRFVLDGGYEVWVGRNAKQNDELTLRHARKYDLWLHARGVGGSHVVLRLPNRQARPGRPLLEAAAAIAAHFSKARGSQLVPVIVAERKYVRKPKGALPGAVIVEREEVLLVEPGLPGG